MYLSLFGAINNHSHSWKNGEANRESNKNSDNPNPNFSYVVVCILGGSSSSGTINGLLSGPEIGIESFTSSSTGPLVRDEDTSISFF